MRYTLLHLKIGKLSGSENWKSGDFSTNISAIETFLIKTIGNSFSFFKVFEMYGNRAKTVNSCGAKAVGKESESRYVKYLGRYNEDNTSNFVRN